MVVVRLGGVPNANCEPSVCREDAITYAEIKDNSDYVEFISPDGMTRLCYLVTTLAGIRRPGGHLAQPPHFRFRMSQADERKVLGNFRNLLSSRNRRITPREMNEYRRRNMEFVYSRMKNYQLYACPVGWTQLTCGIKERYEDGEIWSQRAFQDPMYLCYRYITQREQQGLDGFTEVAALFNTTKRKAIAHLSTAYGIDMSTERDALVNILERYSMRDGDGIMQNYLSKTGEHSTSIGNYWKEEFFFRKSLYMALWLYNKTEDAQLDKRLTDDNTTHDGIKHIVDTLKATLGAEDDEDEDEEEDDEEEEGDVDEIASAAAVTRMLDERDSARRKKRKAYVNSDDEYVNSDDAFLDSSDVEDFMKDIEDQRKKSRKAAYDELMNDDEEDLVGKLNFSLRF